ncbi:MAG: HEAT repeat domain-containing protein [Planctomycetes bacterium]|nr:HEAT repeat domain-containing protein [Planctomycetota bacterium]
MPWRRSWLLAPLFALALAAPWWALPQLARGGPGDEDSHYVQRRRPGRCLCDEGQGTWEYLRSPLRPPADPPWCGLLLAKGDCGSKDRPKGTPGPCWQSQKEECFWKRHAYSWKIHCSQCFEESECDACDSLIGKPDPKISEMLQRQLKIEGYDPRKNRLWIAVSPHFYVVTDIDRKMKVLTKGGAPRLATGHEVAHLFAERCERAYEDFQHWFKGGLQAPKVMGVYLMTKQRAAEAYAERYLGSARTDMLYGGGDTKIGGGFCGNGFVGSLQENRADQDLHAYCRHMIGHILFSCWRKVSGEEKYCPKWAFIGAAHFLEKMLEPHEDYATFCSNETTAPSGSGKDWMKKARGMASKRIDPIQTFFGRNSLADFSYEDHIRAWSLMKLGLEEDQDRFLQMLALLRYGNEEGYAIQESMGFTPDTFQEHWADRLTGKRPTFGEIKKDAKDDEDVGRRERERIKTTEEADVLAGLVRGLHEIKDVKTLAVVVDRLDHPSDLVREAIHLVLARSTDHAVLEWLRTEGLHHKGKMARSIVARALGSMRDELSRVPLEEMLGDDFWLARANAATALQAIGKPESLPALIAAMDDRQSKAWMAITDAVASFKQRSVEATLKAMNGLDDNAWQVRVTACQALAAVGTQECMDKLIERFELEKGRLEREMRLALKSVANDDLGADPATWKKWWDQQKERFGGFNPNEPPKVTNPEDDRYGTQEPPGEDEPHYYGRQIYSRGVGFVFDTSGSMDKNIVIAAGSRTGLGDIPASGTRMEIAREVLATALTKLNPQTKFNLVLFSTTVRPWKKQMVPATPSNTSSAANAVLNAPADGETNIHGALKAALGLHEKPSLEATLEDIPDTVYFLTDGSPTEGEITSTPELLGWFEDINRFGKVKLNVIAFGSLGVDLTFLRALAQVGGGDFIHVPEER